MAVHPLDNRSFGFPADCFVCDAGNASGLRIRFFHDDEAGVVSAEFVFDEHYSGAPKFVHGGIVYTMLDEAMAWATIAVAEKFAVVKETLVTYRRPVKVGQTHRVEAEITERAGKNIGVAARIVDSKGRRCAQASSTFVVLSERMARAAIGADLAGNGRYLWNGDKQ